MPEQFVKLTTNKSVLAEVCGVIENVHSVDSDILVDKLKKEDCSTSSYEGTLSTESWFRNV